MYKCNDCGREFENPKVETEVIGVSDKTGFVDYEYCPFCDSDNINYQEEANLDDE